MAKRRVFLLMAAPLAISVSAAASRRMCSGSSIGPPRPPKPAQRKDLLFLFFAEYIHRPRINPPLILDQLPRWQLFQASSHHYSSRSRSP